MAAISSGLFQSRRGRLIRENLTAYLFLAPAGTIIFLFGLFPVMFAFFVSLHRWRRFPGEYRGLDYYVNALGDFAYVLFFWLALGVIIFGLYALWRIWRESRDERRARLLVLPGAAASAGLFALFNWFFILLPLVLDVPQRLRGQQITQELFISEFFASFRFPEVLAANNLMLLVGIAALIVIVVFLRAFKTERTGFYFMMALASVTALAAGILLMQ
ncbi:MAG: hypothetical protein K8J31_05975, partial [Anaerolineae bacterium]|nr:hypothetical protein [Anaerolineae bacterium]